MKIDTESPAMAGGYLYSLVIKLELTSTAEIHGVGKLRYTANDVPQAREWGAA